MYIFKITLRNWKTTQIGKQTHFHSSVRSQLRNCVSCMIWIFHGLAGLAFVHFEVGASCVKGKATNCTQVTIQLAFKNNITHGLEMANTNHHYV